MQLFIKQKAFSFRDRFAVKDAEGSDRWFAQGEIFSWGRKLRVTNAAGEEVAFLRRKFTFLEQRYEMDVQGQTYFLVREFHLFQRRYHLEGLPWAMQGDFAAHSYALVDGDRQLLRITKAWFTWGDSYQLDIADPQHELLCLCIALAVDCMNADAANSAN